MIPSCLCTDRIDFSHLMKRWPWDTIWYFSRWVKTVLWSQHWTWTPCQVARHCRRTLSSAGGLFRKFLSNSIWSRGCFKIRSGTPHCNQLHVTAVQRLSPGNVLGKCVSVLGCGKTGGTAGEDWEGQCCRPTWKAQSRPRWPVWCTVVFCRDALPKVSFPFIYLINFLFTYFLRWFPGWSINSWAQVILLTQPPK